MSWNWEKILQQYPNTQFVTIDRHGMAAAHVEDPVYYDTSGKWYSPSRQELYLTDAGSGPDFAPASTKERRPEAFKQIAAAPIEHALVTHRRKHGLSQKALAEQLGMSVNFVYMLERGYRSVSLESARKLAAIFDLSLDEVVRWFPRH